MRVLVVGSGVSGLSSAVRLLEAGHDVTVRARELPPYTTSNIAAAFWHPYLAEPKERVLGWATRTYEVLEELSRSPETFIVRHRALEVLHEGAPDPWWSSAVRDFARATPQQLPPGCVAGIFFESVVVETSRYLPWLIERVRKLGGRFEQQDVTDLTEGFDGFDAAVNCSGLGARALAHDDSMHPVRGEILCVDLVEGARLVVDERHPRDLVYIVPRSQDLILGGTADVGEWSLKPDPKEAERIRARCAHLVPAVAKAKLRGHLVGLRPRRPTVRLEREELDGRPVVHNYGHGGAGITLSWGCAEEVRALLSS